MPRPPRLQAAALILAYNQEAYLDHCLRALRGEVDHVVAVYAEVPFSAYNPRAREQFTQRDRTRQILAAHEADPQSPLSVVSGRWETEEAMREAGLARVRELGAPLCLIVDADEFYPAGGIAALRRTAEAAAAPGTVFWAHGLHLFRSMAYLAVEATPRYLPVAVHVTPKTRFFSCRVPTGPRQDLPRDFTYWHVGYVHTSEKMWEKISTFGHAAEVVDGWFEHKWRRWTPQTRDLDRKRPEKFSHTVPIDPRRLPAVLHDHPYFLMALRGEHPP